MELEPFSPKVQVISLSFILLPFSRKLSHAECNYDVGNREPLAVKLTLEEWRHWTEGAAHLHKDARC